MPLSKLQNLNQKLDVQIGQIKEVIIKVEERGNRIEEMAVDLLDEDFSYMPTGKKVIVAETTPLIVKPLEKTSDQKGFKLQPFLKKIFCFCKCCNK